MGRLRWLVLCCACSGSSLTVAPHEDAGAFEASAEAALEAPPRFDVEPSADASSALEASDDPIRDGVVAYALPDAYEASSDAPSALEGGLEASDASDVACSRVLDCTQCAGTCMGTPSYIECCR